jgi:hypothetical protein
MFYILDGKYELPVYATNTRLAVVMSVLWPRTLTRETMTSAFWVQLVAKKCYRILRLDELSLMIVTLSLRVRFSDSLPQTVSLLPSFQKLDTCSYNTNRGASLDCFTTTAAQSVLNVCQS